MIGIFKKNSLPGDFVVPLRLLSLYNMSHPTTSCYRIPSPKNKIDGYCSEPDTPTTRRIDDPLLYAPHLPLQTTIPSLFPSPSCGHALSLPPLSSDGLIHTSPIVGTKEQKKAIISQKSQKKRGATIARKKATHATEEEHIAEDVEAKRLNFFNKTLSSISQQGYTFGQLVLYVSDPQYWQGIA